MQFRLVNKDKREESECVIGSITMIQESCGDDIWKDRYGFTNEEEAIEFLNYKHWIQYLIDF